MAVFVSSDPTVELAAVPLRDGLVALAHASGANAVAADARRSCERLEQARLHVAIVGRPDMLAAATAQIVGRPVPTWWFLESETIELRYRRGPCELRGPLAAPTLWADTPVLRRGACVTAGAVEATWPLYRRTDLIVVDARDAVQLSRVPRWRHARNHVVDETSGVARAVGEIERLAAEIGAAAVEPAVVEDHRQLCMRLRFHLAELERALGRSDAEQKARINALTIAQGLAESAVETSGCRPDVERERLATRLGRERTKFLMGHTADALGELGERITQLDVPRQQACNVARELALAALSGFWDRLAKLTGQELQASMRRRVDELDTALAELGELLPPDAMAGVERLPLHGFRRSFELTPTGTVLAQLAERIGIGRRRVEVAAREELVEALDVGSRAIVGRLLGEADDARDVLDQRFGELVDAALESARAGAGLASRARAADGDGLGDARKQLASWSTELAALATRVD
jgi:hypothetical protein